jgi:hypothetical protein
MEGCFWDFLTALKFKVLLSEVQKYNGTLMVLSIEEWNGVIESYRNLDGIR